MSCGTAPRLAAGSGGGNAKVPTVKRIFLAAGLGLLLIASSVFVGMRLDRQFGYVANSTVPDATPTPTATALPFSPQVMEVASKIERSVFIARLLESLLGAGARASIGPNLCGEIPHYINTVTPGIPMTIYHGFHGQNVPPGANPAAGLWPRVYADLDQELASACGLLAFVVDLRDSDWPPVAARIRASLRQALDVLPDHSPAQLRRAIAERE